MSITDSTPVTPLLASTTPIDSSPCSDLVSSSSFSIAAASKSSLFPLSPSPPLYHSLPPPPFGVSGPVPSDISSLYSMGAPSFLWSSLLSIGTDRVRVRNGSLLPIKHVGSLNISTASQPLVLNNVLHVPSLKHNLLSAK